MRRLPEPWEAEIGEGREPALRMLLLVPAAWKAGPKGLPLEKAVKVTGARSVKNIEDLVTSAGAFALGPSLPEDFVAVSIEAGRVVVDRALQLSTPPRSVSARGRRARRRVATLRERRREGGGSIAPEAPPRSARALPCPGRPPGPDHGLSGGPARILGRLAR
jgi:proteasome accessory factor C